MMLTWFPRFPIPMRLEEERKRSQRRRKGRREEEERNLQVVGLDVSVDEVSRVGVLDSGDLQTRERGEISLSVEEEKETEERGK